MKKLPQYLENPFDNIIYVVIELIAPTIHKIGLTPNMITTLGNVCTIFFTYYFIEKKYVISSIYFGFSYFFDCLDGFIARSYNLVTKFGDYYDHISDLVKAIIYIYLFLSTNFYIGSIYIFIISIFAILSFVNLAHQEKYYNNPSASKTLQIFNCFSLAKNKSEASL